VVDVHAGPKLAYWVARNCYQPVYISGLHGNTVLRNDEAIKVTASNYAETLTGAVLQMHLLDSRSQLINEQIFSGLEISGGVALSEAALVTLPNLEPGLYSIELVLHDQANAIVTRTVELFFIEDALPS
jgi:hypothetical protein